MKRICIFCASSPRIPKHYIDTAREVGTLMARSGCTLVYGGGSIGLMGAVADAMLRQGAPVIGVIPQFMVDVEWQHPGVEDMRRTTTMAERKRMMIDLADALLVLPGSIGTLDEMFQTLSERKLGMLGKPVVLLNDGGFYDATLEQLRRMVEENFMTQAHLDKLAVARTADEALRLCLMGDTGTSTLREGAVN